MSKIAELTAAVDRAVQILTTPPPPDPNTTPDSEVQAQVDRLNAATPPTS